MLTATKKVRFPGMLAGMKVPFRCYMVNSVIPMLWSKPSMVKAKVVMNLPEDKAQILGTWVDLDLTTAGDYALHILPVDERKDEESLLVQLPDDERRGRKS